MILVNKISAFLFAILFALGGCTELPALGSAKTVEEQEAVAATRALIVRSNSIILKNTLQGAGIGALVGGVGTLLAGGSQGDIVRNAAIGAAVGGAGGAAVGTSAAQSDTAIQSRKQALERLDNTNAQVTDARTKVQRAIAVQDRELSTLRTQLRAGEVSRAQYDARVDDVNKTRKVLKDNLTRSSDTLEKKRSNVTDSAVSSRAKSVESRIDSINSQIRFLSTG